MPFDVEAILRTACGLVKDRPIIVGVSGGPDSLCLMDVLRQAGYSIVVAHFDHQLRAESSQDARMVEETASRLALACVVDGADVRADAEQNKLSIEEAARKLRYRFLFKLARERGAQAVAVGHTADDQVETILMHFLRGSGLSGLKGMEYRTVIQTFDVEIPIARPLLNMRRAETVAYCAANGLRPHYDASNDSLDFQRNRIRRLLIPELENYNPKLRESVFRMAQALKGDHALLTEILDSAWRESLITQGSGFFAFDFFSLSKYARGLNRNLIKRAMQILVPDIDVDFAALERAADALNGDSARVDLKSGLYLFRELNRVYVSALNAELPLNLFPQMKDNVRVAVSIPAQVELANGWKFDGARCDVPDLEKIKRNDDSFQVWLDADVLPASLELRARRQGDRFAPLGMDGHSQKLSDFFVNEKMPQRARARWVLLCAGDEIIWAAGYRPAHSYRVTASTRNAIHFSISPPT